MRFGAAEIAGRGSSIRENAARAARFRMKLLVPCAGCGSRGCCATADAASVFLRGVAAQKTGGVAQLGERLLCKQEVVGSIPITSTTERAQLVSTARNDTKCRSSRQARGGCGAGGDRSGMTSLPMGESSWVFDL